MEQAMADGFPFTYLVVLFEGRAIGPPTAGDSEAWAEATRLDTPVLADPTQRFVDFMPYEGGIPARCGLTPRMQMLGCYTGEAPEVDPAIEAIRAHWQAGSE